MTQKWKRWLAPAALAVAAATLAACSSSGAISASVPAGSSTAGSGSSPAGSGASPASTGLTKAQQMVQQLEAPLSSYPVPTAPVSGAASVKGKTFFYIPIITFAPQFVATAAALKTALGVVGAKLQVCNGQSQPAAISACLGQATGAGAAGIILDSIPVGMAQNSISAATAKGIPVIIADQLAPAGTSNTDKLSYVEGAISQPSDMAYWIIADSGGKANLIINEKADSPSSIAYVQTSLPIYKQYCPGCTVTVKQTNSSLSTATVASDTSSDLLQDPDATYFYTEFEDNLQPVMQGIQQSNKASAITLSTAGGSTDGLGLLAKGNTPVKAVIAVDEPYAGYALTDELLRMVTGSAPVQEAFPSRLFTKDNIASIQVTAAAQASGAWFGDNSYQSAFAQLWGVG